MSELRISEIQIIPIKPKEGLVAFASCVINKALYLGNIAVYSSPSTQSGFRLVYPVKILPNGKEIHCIHPISKVAGEIISKAIIRKFREIASKATG
jgi:stage V sporulation protein G